MTEDVWKQLDAMRREFTDNTHIQRPLLEAMIDHHKAVVEDLDAALAHIETLRDRISLASHPAKELLREMERLDKPGYRWPRLAAEQVVEALEGGATDGA